MRGVEVPSKSYRGIKSLLAILFLISLLLFLLFSVVQVPLRKTAQMGVAREAHVNFIVEMTGQEDLAVPDPSTDAGYESYQNSSVFSIIDEESYLLYLEGFERFHSSALLLIPLPPLDFEAYRQLNPSAGLESLTEVYLEAIRQLSVREALTLMESLQAVSGMNEGLDSTGSSATAYGTDVAQAIAAEISDSLAGLKASGDFDAFAAEVRGTADRYESQVSEMIAEFDYNVNDALAGYSDEISSVYGQVDDDLRGLILSNQEQFLELVTEIRGRLYALEDAGESNSRLPEHRGIAYAQESPPAEWDWEEPIVSLQKWLDDSGLSESKCITTYSIEDLERIFAIRKWVAFSLMILFLISILFTFRGASRLIIPGLLAGLFGLIVYLSIGVGLNALSNVLNGSSNTLINVKPLYNRFWSHYLLFGMRNTAMIVLLSGSALFLLGIFAGIGRAKKKG